MAENQETNTGCLPFVGGAAVGASLYVIIRARVLLGVVLFVLWMVMLHTKNQHHGTHALDATLSGLLFLAWLVLRVRRFMRKRRENQASGPDDYYQG